MNYAYYKKLQKKEFIKNMVFVTFILIFACFSTYIIYNTFENKRDEILKSNSIDVTYHDGNKVNITKVTPVTDYVGLSKDAYTFTVKNNTNRVVNYEISLSNNNDLTTNDDCANKLIPHEIIKLGIHKKGEVSKIYTLDDLSSGIVEKNKLEPLEEIDYVMRFWINEDAVVGEKNLHYHGIINVVEK